MFSSNESLGIFTSNKQHLHSAALEFTSRCNLRCTYCTVSLPNDVAEDLDPATDEEMLLQLKALGVDEVSLNGRGETTSMANWMDRVRPFIQSFRTRLITNCARRFSDAEVELLSQLRHLSVSIDSANPVTMRQIRRRVDLETVLGNILRIRIAGMAKPTGAPELQISCGVYDRNVLELPGLARLAAGIGAAEVGFWNLVKYEDIEGAVNVRSINEMPPGEQKLALAAIDETIGILTRSGLRFYFAGNFADVFRAQVLSAGLTA